MSARDVVLRDRALATTLRSFSRRSKELSRRASWPGATQSTTSASVSIPLVTTLGAPVWNDILTLSLDPGTWMLVASVTVPIPVGIAGPVWRTGIRVGGTTITSEGRNSGTSLSAGPMLLQAHAPVRVTSSGYSTALEMYSEMDVGGVPGYFAIATTPLLLAYPV